MATVVGAYSGDSITAVVGVAGVGAVAVFCHYVVPAQGQRQVETAFAVSNPYACFHAREAAEHHRVVLRDCYTKEVAFKFVASVVLHPCTFLVVGVDEVELNHELASVADAEAEGVGAFVEAFKCRFGFLIPFEASCPAFCGAKNVGV